MKTRQRRLVVNVPTGLLQRFPNKPTAVITAENAAQIASTGVMFLLNGGSLFDFGSYSPENFIDEYRSRAFPQGIETYLKETLEAERSRLASMGLRASQSEISCDTGSGRVTASFSNPEDAAAGDSVVVSFTDCEFQYGSYSDVLNGSLSLTLGQITSSSATLTYAAKNFRVAEKVEGEFTGDYELMHGDYTMSVTMNPPVTSLRITNESMSFEGMYSGTKQQVVLRNVDYFAKYDSSQGTYTYSANCTIDSSDFKGVIILNTISDFVITEGIPLQGKMIITGANNAKIRLTVQSDSTVRIEYDLDGNGIYGDNGDPAPGTF